MTRKERVMATIAQALGVDAGDIEDHTSTTDIAAWDSVGRMSILFAISEEFGIELAPNETSNLSSVESILAIVQARAAAE